MPIQLKREQKTFVDISLAFTPNPLSGDLTTIKDNRAINNSIKNLILIKPNEVPFQRDIGSSVSDLLFEFCDDITAELLQIEIRRTIEFNEPRVELEQVEVIAYPEQNHFEVTIKYKIVGYNEVFTVEQILRPTR